MLNAKDMTREDFANQSMLNAEIEYKDTILEGSVDLDTYREIWDITNSVVVLPTGETAFIPVK